MAQHRCIYLHMHETLARYLDVISNEMVREDRKRFGRGKSHSVVCYILGGLDLGSESVFQYGRARLCVGLIGIDCPTGKTSRSTSERVIR